MSRVSRRAVLRAAGVVGALGLAGCGGESGGDEPSTATPTTRTATGATTPTDAATETPTSMPRRSAAGSLGFEAMLGTTPAHPEMVPEAFVWARYVDVESLLGNVEDETLAGRLRDGWLGSGPPRYADSDAFELVHVQPGSLSNVTFGCGEFSSTAAVEGMVTDGWTRREGGAAGFDLLERGGYTTAVGETVWLVTRTAETDATGALTRAVGRDPVTDYLGPVDREAVAKATAEAGDYRVLERSVSGEYAAGIAVDYAPHRVPAGVMQYAAGRESPTWERVEHRFERRIVGEVRSSDFGDEFG